MKRHPIDRKSRAYGTLSYIVYAKITQLKTTPTQNLSRVVVFDHHLISNAIHFNIIYIYIYIYIHYSFPQKLSSVEFPVNISQFLLNLDCEYICDPPGGDALLAQRIYLTDYIYIYTS